MITRREKPSAPSFSYHATKLSLAELASTSTSPSTSTSTAKTELAPLTSVVMMRSLKDTLPQAASDA